MNANELVARYVTCHSYEHATERGKSLAKEVCYVPAPARLGDDRRASAGEIQPVCYVP